MIRLKSLIREIEDKPGIFGLGTVDSHGVVYFKKFPSDYLDTMSHNSAGIPMYKDRFRYDDGWVEWTDVPTKQSRIAVENYLAKQHLKFDRHSSYWGIDDVMAEPDDDSDAPAATPAPNAGAPGDAAPQDAPEAPAQAAKPKVPGV